MCKQRTTKQKDSQRMDVQIASITSQTVLAPLYDNEQLSGNEKFAKSAKKSTKNKLGEYRKTCGSPEGNANGAKTGGRRVTTPKMKASSPIAVPRSGSRSPLVKDGVSKPLFAGAKFHDPPSPKSLPKPPTHWIRPDSSSPSCAASECLYQPNSRPYHDKIADQLKTWLKVQN